MRNTERLAVSAAWRGGIGWVAMIAVGCTEETPPPTAPFTEQVVASGLEAPWSLSHAPDGRLFIAERPGRIRVVAGDTLAAAPWAAVPVHASAAAGLETGLMGLAVDPDFAANRRVHICYTHRTDTGGLVNRIAYYIESAGRGVGPTVVVDGIPAGSYHNGCRLKFGPDGRLYATTGDGAGDRPGGVVAQSVESLAGKTLRLEADGTVPANNPFAGSYIWTLGHRNAQGLAFQPESGRLYATEHGTGGGGNNELNLIERGGNYGWPEVIGVAGDDRFIDPVLVREEAPAGATFVTSDHYPGLRGSLLIGTLGMERLVCVGFGPDGFPDSTRTRVLVEGVYGRLRDVIEGPDGYIYVATSNRDGRGRPRDGDDRVLRLVPGH